MPRVWLHVQRQGGVCGPDREDPRAEDGEEARTVGEGKADDAGEKSEKRVSTAVPGIYRIQCIVCSVASSG